MSPNDNNNYTFGKIRKHNIVITALPDRQYSTPVTAGVAVCILSSFPKVRIGLLVSVGGGAPSPTHNVRLRDIVVSTLFNSQSSVVQYDIRKTIQGQRFKPTGFLNKPPTILRAAISTLRARYEREGHQLKEMVKEALKKKPKLRNIPELSRALPKK